jgi:hypothetical protein
MGYFPPSAESLRLPTSGASPIDLSKMEQAAAATRQKSCDACVRGKRKCDKRMPRCARCAARGIECRYKKTPPSASPSDNTASASSAISASAAGASRTPGSPPLATPTSSVEGDPYASLTSTSFSASVSETSDFDMDFNVDHLGVPNHHSTATEALAVDLQLDPNLTIPDLDFMSGPDSLWSMPSFVTAMAAAQEKEGLSLVPSMPNVDHPAVVPRKQIRDAKDIQCIDKVDPLEIYDPRTRVGYMTARIKEMHIKFAQTRDTPFLHPRVWSPAHSAPSAIVANSMAVGQPDWRGAVPQTILTAFSAISAYVNRNPQTMPWIMRLVLDASREIVREGSRPNLTPRQKLARVVAMLMLDTIRVFDGDVAARAGVERDREIFLSWVEELTKVREDLEKSMPSEADSRRDQPPDSWEDWVFLESVRRTILTSVCFICLFQGLKSESMPQRDFISTMSHMASSHLWNATSAAQFYHAWHEKPRFFINNMSYNEFWLYARPDDLDEFTTMLLTAQVGPEMMDFFMQGEVTTIPMPCPAQAWA